MFIDECIESTRDIVRKRDLYPKKREITFFIVSFQVRFDFPIVGPNWKDLQG